ncbi:hypothetical protein QL285_088490 [Trifolium repens]|nr:hypothetical protein QL285_088490 [Trifolium repens]
MSHDLVRLMGFHGNRCCCCFMKVAATIGSCVDSGFNDLFLYTVDCSGLGKEMTSVAAVVLLFYKDFGDRLLCWQLTLLFVWCVVEASHELYDHQDPTRPD